MKCGICQKEIHDKQKYIDSYYGPFCSESCWYEEAKVIVGRFEETRDVAEEEKIMQERKNSKRVKPHKWGDDL
ncbi:hypothetical protein P8918_12620 [Bacillus spizizenii]|nr:hypothetical protein [Bacillus spizizenii]MCY8890413.1 hypothetical protein [Bacillus spizizenii]MEC0841868.1 hypothetical protein [Bacillus spizizenii]